MKKGFVKITLAQQLPAGVEETAALVEELLREQQQEDTGVARWILFPESCLCFNFRRSNGTSGLEPLLALSRRAGLIVTCRELEGANVFVTTVVLDDGVLVTSYRKRRATRSNAHAEGKEPVFFEACGGVSASILICFDAENADVRDEVFRAPHRRGETMAVLNPTHIPPLQSAPAWRTALTSMVSKFAKRCGDESVVLLRCDQPLPAGAGSSQLIGPNGSVSCASAAPCALSVFVPTDSTERLSNYLKPPKRDRTKLEDNSGVKCNTSFYDYKKEMCRSVAHLPGSVWGLFGDVSLVALNQRDGSVVKSVECEQRVSDMCHLPQEHAFAWSFGQLVALLDEATLQKRCAFQCGRNSVLRAVGEHSLLWSDSHGASVIDVRSGDISEQWKFPEEPVALWADCESVCVGSEGWFRKFDRRKSGTYVVAVEHRGERVGAVGRDLYACGSEVRNEQGTVVASYNVAVTALEDRFVGLQDGSIVMNGGAQLALHSCRIARLAVSRDRFGLLSVSAKRGHGLALSEFEFNCEKAYTVDNMFITDSRIKD